MKLSKTLISFVIFFFTHFHSVSQSVYYISNAGSDKNTGKEQSRPWKTIREYQPGATYLLRCGDTFYFKIPFIGNSNKQISISSYGFGNRPIISLYKYIRPKSWNKYSGNIWRVNLKDIGNFDGFKDSTDVNVGFVRYNGIIRGIKVTSLSKLRDQWSFYNDDEFLYLKCNYQLNRISKKIAVATNHNIIQLSNNMFIRDIELRGTGGHGIQGKSVSNVTIRNVKISEIGGSYLQGFSNGTTRYGNGIEFLWSGSSCTVQFCDISQIYDAAVTMQTRSKNTVFKDIAISENKIHDSEQSFEFWTEFPTSSFLRCTFSNNICFNAGLGWSHNVRSDRKSGVHLLTYFTHAEPYDITISNNVFDRAKSGYMRVFGNHLKRMPFKSNRNKVSLIDSNYILLSDTIIKSAKWRDFIKRFKIEDSSSISINVKHR